MSRQALIAWALAALASCACAQTIGPPVLPEKAPERIPLPDRGQPAASLAEALKQADAAYDAGRFAPALTLYQQAASAPDAKPTDRLILTHKIGRTQTKLRRLDDAVASFDSGLALLAQTSPTVQAHVEPVLRQARGEALRAQGQPSLARAEYQRALEAYQALGQEASAARMQAEVGSTYVDEARFSEALRQYEGARRRMEASASPELGRLLVNTSSLLTWLGKYDDALTLQTQAEGACEAARDATCQASAAHVQGFTRYQLGDYESAAAASRRAVRLFGESQRVERARALNNLGLSLVALRQPQEALGILKQSMALLDEAGGDAKDKATTIDSMASAYRGLNDYKTAGTLYQDALLRWRIAGHREGERDTLANLGQLAADMKQTEASIFYYKLSVNLAQSLRADARQLEAGFLDSITRRLAPSYQALAGELVDQGRLGEAQQVMRMLKEQELFDFLRRDGPAGGTTATLNGLEQSQRQAYESLQLRLFQLARELDELAGKPSASLTDADRARRAELQALLRRANDELEKFLVELNRALAQADRSTDAVADGRLVRLQGTLDALGRGAVVLHYVPLPDHLSIILTARQSQAVRGYRVDVSQKDLNEAIFRFRDQISHVDPAAKTTAQKLHGWLMPPVLRADLADAGAKILMVSLADSLRYVPLAALHDGQQWLVERYAVAMFNDAVTDALKNAPQPQWSVRAFGMTQAVEGFPALSWVRSEIDAILGTQGLPGSADFDADFTFDRLSDAVTQKHPPVLHIASHFVFRPGTEDDSFLLLGVGRLTLTDIKRMKFGNLDLLTLSACETAMNGGLNVNGREVEGFAALAQERGADAVLATLWSVADISTAAFMQSFYQARRAHPELTKVEALQSVQLAMIRGEITAASARAAVARGEVEGSPGPARTPTDFSHPFYWAPFVLSGNWR